nr:MAG TPA: hypothetical protein [Caudoviricetes sp.]
MWQHRSHWQYLILCLILTTPVGSVPRPTARKGKKIFLNGTFENEKI